MNNMNIFVLDRNNVEKDDGNSYSMKYVCSHDDDRYVYNMCKSHWVDGTLVNEEILVEFNSKGDIVEASRSLKETYEYAKHVADGDIIILFEMIIPNDDDTPFSGAITDISSDRTNYLYVNSVMGVERYEGSIAKYHQFNRDEGDTRPIWGITMWMERRFADKHHSADDVYRYYKSHIDRRIAEYNEFHKHDLGSETING